MLPVEHAHAAAVVVVGRLEEVAGAIRPEVAGRREDLRRLARLGEPAMAESTTFWKATYGKPTDFTLKKRYLVAVLDEVDFVDGRNGEILCRIRPGQARCTDR